MNASRSRLPLTGLTSIRLRDGVMACRGAGTRMARSGGLTLTDLGRLELHGTGFHPVQPMGDLCPDRERRDGDARVPVGAAGDVPADLEFGVGVESACPLVEDEQPWPHDQGAGQRNALTLSSGQPRAMFADSGVDAFGQ